MSMDASTETERITPEGEGLVLEDDAVTTEALNLSADEQEVEGAFDKVDVEDPSLVHEATNGEGGVGDTDMEQEELLPDPQEEFVDEEQLLSLLESLLFASDRPVSIGAFKTIFKGTNMKSRDIKRGLETLMSSYAEAARGVTLEEIGNGWQLRTKADNLPFLRKLGKSRPFKLSGPALEVLSILAYKQPLVKSEIDHIRGVESGHLVRALMDRGLACFQGKSDLPGKPMQYGTTRKFLEIFGLRNLKELPSLDEIDQLLPDGIGYDEEEETLSDVTDSMSEAVGAKYSEGEEELGKIAEKLDAIDTSSEFFEDEKRRQKEKRERERARDIREARDLGDDVPSKDLRWLDRYEAKLAEQEAAATDGTQESVPQALADAQTEDEAFAALSAAENAEALSSVEDQLKVLTAESTPLEASTPNDDESIVAENGDDGDETLALVDSDAGPGGDSISAAGDDDIGEPINGLDA